MLPGPFLNLVEASLKPFHHVAKTAETLLRHLDCIMNPMDAQFRPLDHIANLLGPYYEPSRKIAKAIR